MTFLGIQGAVTSESNTFFALGKEQRIAKASTCNSTARVTLFPAFGCVRGYPAAFRILVSFVFLLLALVAIDMKRSRVSDMWNYFTRLDKDCAKCKICGKKLSYKSSITNLKKHLQSSHVTVIFSSENPVEPNLRNSTPAEELPLEVTPGACSVEPVRAVPSQSNITTYIPKRLGEHQKNKVDGQLLKLFTKDFQPFSVVEDEGFRSFVHALNPSYAIPSRKHIANVMLPGAYVAAKEKVAGKLSTVKTICLTTDCWTSAANESYMAVTGHYIAEDFTLQSVLLGCGQFAGSHTAVKLSASLREITEKYQVNGKILLVVTDNAPNIKNAVVEILQWKHFGCYAHTLNLVVQHALSPVQAVLNKVKNIVAFFKRSSLASGKLVDYQKNNGVSNVKKLIQETPTRWNSTLYMVERFVELADAVIGSLWMCNPDMPKLTDDEWVICKELCSVLKPFEEVSTRLSAEHYPTGSQVIVISRGLLAICEELKKRQFHDVTKAVVGGLLDGVKDRFSKVEYSKSMAVATLLDPRFKLLGFGDMRAAENAKKALQDLVAGKVGDSRCGNTSRSQETSVTTSTTSDTLSVWGIFDDIVRSKQPQGTPQSGAIVEVQRYLESPVISRTEDPLAWWRDNQYVYPNVAKVVKERYNVVATSVPCERIFSKTGLIINDRRTRLNPTKVEQLIFLNMNDDK